MKITNLTFVFRGTLHYIHTALSFFAMAFYKELEDCNKNAKWMNDMAIAPLRQIEILLALVQ